MIRFPGWPALWLVIVLLALPAVAGAQSLLAGSGLGLPAEALDARAQALGGVGLGLSGLSLSLVNPAEVAGIPAPALVVAFQPTWTDFDYAGGTGDVSTSRFPLLHAAAPLGARWAVSAGFGSYLDQNFATEGRDTLTLAGARYEATDRRVMDGGVTRLRFGAAFAVTERLAVGAGLDLFTGSRMETLTRRFAVVDSTQTAPTLLPATRSTDAEFGGVGVVVGARWNPSAALSLAAAFADGGSLDAEPRAGADSLAARSYSIPARVSAGASGRVSQGAAVALGAEWTGWSAADDDLADSGGARDALRLGGGVELDPAGPGERAFPLRVGARYARLPFRRIGVGDAADFPTERALTAGIGARLGGGAALLDLAAERGSRGAAAAGVEEAFWRATLSLTLLGR